MNHVDANSDQDDDSWNLIEASLNIVEAKSALDDDSWKLI